MMIHFFAIILFILNDCPKLESSCSTLHYCHGHGKCINENQCECYVGWGANTDISNCKAPDCSRRTCPSDIAWGDLPLVNNVAHQIAECSNAGLCNYVTGECECFERYEGNACQRMKCPNDCSGHGVCYSMKKLADIKSALPLHNETYYQYEPLGYGHLAWDDDKIFGCLCDSSWPVGIGPGERQVSEWFGPDCSLKHCPSGDNPFTPKDETNCWNISATNSNAIGEKGNICQVDCANLGNCDYSIGECKCYFGHTGPDCTGLTTIGSSLFFPNYSKHS